MSRRRSSSMRRSSRASWKLPSTLPEPCMTSHIQCGTDPFEQQLMIERFRKELDRALSHRSNPHPGISVGSNEDDRDIAFLIFQPGLQLQTRHLRHLDVSYQARGLTVQTRCEEFFRGSKAPCDQPSRFHQVAQ